MAFAYFLICSASVLFGCQFIFQQKYQQCEGTSVCASMRMSLIASALQILLLFIMPGGLDGFTPQASGIAAISAINNIFNVYFIVKVFECADMALFSIFEMLGGMTLPFAAGILFFDEAITLHKTIGFFLIAFSLVIETGKFSKTSFKSVLYYAGLFITNGLSGVFAKFNQSLENGASANAFLMMTSAFTVVLCMIALAYQKLVCKKDIKPKSTKKTFLCIVPYIIIATLGSVCLLSALETLPASVQYPISTGGTIVVSVIISTIRKEHPAIRSYIAAVIAVASAIIIAL